MRAAALAYFQIKSQILTRQLRLGSAEHRPHFTDRWLFNFTVVNTENVTLLKRMIQNGGSMFKVFLKNY